MGNINGDLLGIEGVVLGVEIRTIPGEEYWFDADNLPRIPDYPVSEILKDLAVMATECARGERDCFTALTNTGILHIPTHIIKAGFIEFYKPTSEVLQELYGDDAA